MNWLKRKRYYQVIRYGWTDARKIAKETGNSWLREYYNLLMCFYKHYVFSNQYTNNRLWALSSEEKEALAHDIGEKNIQHDNWAIDKYNNRKFITKWSSLRWGCSRKRMHRRKKAYTKQFNAGDGFIVQHNVDIHREHYLEGTIKIGNNVTLAKNVFIDYSGELIIHDDVAIANGVIIETHTHILEKNRMTPKPGRLEIGDNVKILTRAYIADTCHSIGRGARIGAGTYVRGNIPPYAIVMGNPARIIGFLYSPEEMVEFEKTRYSIEERTPLDTYEKQYEKFFRRRSKEIREFVKL